MSKSAMLRTRRRDVNVKPNRRLDRKSSRGMIYENEELRLRTININAEIERGQSDIKKLRRENDQLRKEIWCLRDEYEKLDKLLKEKGDDTSCSSCSIDTDSCTSCSESEDNETTQNMENVQKTTLNNLRTEFDHLSVVTEETSAENSDKNSLNAISSKECGWDVIPPDQSYPNSQTLPLPTTKSALPVEHMPKHFFAPLKPSKSYENCHENNLCYSTWSLSATSPHNWMPFLNFDQNFLDKQPPAVMQKPVLPARPHVAQNDLQVCKKTAPDILVKTDFPNLSQESNTNSLVNGRNLDELLQDIQTISNDILQISAQCDSNQKINNNFVPNVTVDQYEPVSEAEEMNLEEMKQDSNYKSELNVVLMPQAMPLLGFEKYQNLKSSLESVATIKKSSESIPLLDIPTSEIIPPNVAQSFTPQPFPADFSPELLNFPCPTPQPAPPPRPQTPAPQIHPEISRQTSNPFFYGIFDNFHNSETFANHLNPEMLKKEAIQQQQIANKPEDKADEKTTNIKTNIENEIVQNKVGNKAEKEGKQEKNENEKNDSKKESNKKDQVQKSPKTRRTRKVSIYFKGKKDKLARSLSLDTKMTHHEPLKHQEKSPIIDDRKTNAKTSSSESKVSLFEPNPLKTQDSNEKIINSDTNKTSSDSKNSNYDRKHRKSSSTSPERKHGHVKVADDKKCHKKRHRKSERRIPANRRASLSADRTRERSFSICTDRSNILDHKFGQFDDFTNSERDRSNSLSSCETVKSRKLSSTVTQFPVSGKIPWFGCWGNGCL